MVKYLAMLIVLTEALLSVGCGMPIGPAYPERDGRIYLLAHGYSRSETRAVIEGGELSPSLAQKLSGCSSPNVRYLVARNSHLSQEQIDVFIADSDYFVRSGAARNTGLSSNQVETLSADDSHTVYAALAGNPSLSDEQLLRIHAQREPGLVYFAMNPNCPATIRQLISESTDESAKKWLEITDTWKKEGRFVKGEDGRWKVSHDS